MRLGRRPDTTVTMGMSWSHFVVADLSVQSHAHGLIAKVKATESGSSFKAIRKMR